MATGQDWDPLAEAMQNLSNEEGARLQAECPRMPPSQYLWGWPTGSCASSSSKPSSPSRCARTTTSRRLDAPNLRMREATLAFTVDADTTCYSAIWALDSPRHNAASVSRSRSEKVGTWADVRPARAGTRR